MPSDELKHEEKPKGPPGEDQDFEELFGKLDINEEKNNDIPLQPIINKNAEDLKELVQPSTQSNSVTERGFEDDQLDGKLLSDHGHGRRTHTRNTTYQKDGGLYDPQSYRNNPFSMAPPPPYPGTTFGPKHRKEQENYQQQQNRLQLQQQQLQQQEQLFLQLHGFLPQTFAPQPHGSVSQSASLPGFAVPPQGTNSGVPQLSQSLPNGMVQQQQWGGFCLPGNVTPLAPVFQPSNGLGPTSQVPSSQNSFYPAESTHDQINGSDISTEEEAIALALAISLDHPQPSESRNQLTEPTIQSAPQYFFGNGQNVSPLFQDPTIRSSGSSSSLHSSDIEPDCAAFTPPSNFVPSNIINMINFVDVSAELPGKKRKTSPFDPAITEVPQNKSPKSDDSRDDHSVPNSQDNEDDGFCIITREEIAGIPRAHNNQEMVSEHKDVPDNGVPQHLGWSSEPVHIPGPRINKSGNVPNVPPTPPSSHLQNEVTANGSVSQSKPSPNPIHFVNSADTGNIPSTSTDELLKFLIAPGPAVPCTEQRTYQGKNPTSFGCDPQSVGQYQCEGVVGGSPVRYTQNINSQASVGPAGDFIHQSGMNPAVAQGMMTPMHNHHNHQFHVQSMNIPQTSHPSKTNTIINQRQAPAHGHVFPESFPQSGSANSLCSSSPNHEDITLQGLIQKLSSSVPSASPDRLADIVPGCGQPMSQCQSPDPQLSDVDVLSQCSPHPSSASPSGVPTQDVSGRGSVNSVPCLDDIIPPSPASCISEGEDDVQENKIDDNTVVHYFSDLPEEQMKKIYQDNKEFVQENINTMNRLRQTPLYVAVMTKNCAAACLLVQLGADPCIQGMEAKSEVMQAPLHKAIDLGDARMVDTLLSSRLINIEQPRIYDRKTPLMVALHGHNCQQEERDRRIIVQLLVRQGANVEKLDEQSDKTVLMMAIETRDIVLIEYMLQYVDVSGTRDLINRPNRVGNTSLHIAAGLTQLDKEDHLDLLKMLVYFGGNTDAVNLDNKTPKDWKKCLFDEMRSSIPYQPSQ